MSISQKQKQPVSLKQGLVIFVIGLLLGWQVTLHINPASPQTTSLLGSSAGSESTDLSSEESNTPNMDLFWETYERLQDKYFDAAEVTQQDIVYGAIHGMVEALGDPYSGFMTPEETQAFESSLNGELEGIGAELTVREGKLVVVAPLKDSPAQQEGLLPADHIYLVDGEATADMTLWDAIMAIRGTAGTNVTLTVLREDVDEAIDITITRQEIQVPSLETSVTEQNGQSVGTIAVYQFSDDTAIEFKSALRQLALQEVDSLILDLRGNGGGFLDVSVEMLGEFFEEQVPGVIVKRRGSEDDIMSTPGDGLFPDIPMAVLINEGSASASEIVAGALQDYERAILIGEQSFGKGSVQELGDLTGGSSLRVTVAKWFTPEGRTIDHTGITPDVIVEMDLLNIDTEDDLQLQAALDYLAP